MKFLKQTALQFLSNLDFLASLYDSSNVITGIFVLTVSTSSGFSSTFSSF